jgi:hypothetical protein
MPEFGASIIRSFAARLCPATTGSGIKNLNLQKFKV